jgi:putative heme-binding domain-containing protein
MAEVGPDGNVWVLDWYNFIVQHNPTPQGFSTGKGNAYETKLRDKKFGRIYRVVYEGTEGLAAEELSRGDALVRKGLRKADEAGLVAALRHPNMFWRKAAQRLLLEKGALEPATIALLKGLVQDASTDEIGMNVGAMHAIWVLSAQGEWGGPWMEGALRHPSPGVRRNAIAAAAPTPATASAVNTTGLIQDRDAQVRLAAMLKLADCPPGSPSDQALLSVQQFAAVQPQSETDRWLLDAWTSTASAHAERSLPLLMRSLELQPSQPVLERIAIVAEHAARKRLTSEALSQFVVSGGNPQVTASVVSGLVEGWPKDHPVELSEQASRDLVSNWLTGALPLETKSQVIQLASSLGISKLEDAIASVRGELLGRVQNANLTSEARVAAAKQMVVLESNRPEVIDALLDQVTPQSQPELASGIVQSLGGAKVDGLVERLIERAKSMPPDFLKNSVRVMLGRPETTRDLIAAISDGKLSINDLQLDQRQLLRDHPDASIREKAIAMMKTSGGIPNPDRQKLVESWMAVSRESGDAAAGKALYQKHCALCHRHGDLGNHIGPDLTGMAVHPKAELLINILDPNRSVEGNYRTYNVQTVDGTIVTGMMAGESKTAIELINVQGKREVVLREDIEQLTGSQKSLMPEGFESQMTQSELKDLLEFLTTKGKYVPLSLASVASIVTTRGMFFDPEGEVERLVFSDWAPKMFHDIPFVLVDPLGDRVPNAVMLYGPQGKMAPSMPKSVEVVCNAPAVAIHFLSGIGGWSFPASRIGTTSMIVRVTYADDTAEDHALINGQHFADYIRRIDVPESEFAFDLAGRQVRYFAVRPRQRKALKKIDLIKGDDATAPVVMAMTLQTQE